MLSDGQGYTRARRAGCLADGEFGARLADETRARLVSFPGCSHWWQLERPGEVAAEHQRLWASR